MDSNRSRPQAGNQRAADEQFGDPRIPGPGPDITDDQPQLSSSDDRGYCQRHPYERADECRECAPATTLAAASEEPESPPETVPPSVAPQSYRVLQDCNTDETCKTEGGDLTGHRLFKASDLDIPAPTTWLVKGHLPRGDVAVLVGDEGIGKSLWWVLIVAAITTGHPLPLLGIPARSPQRVVLALTEDSWGEVRQRLIQAGADLDNVYVIADDIDGSGSPSFPGNLGLIYDAAAAGNVALVVVDAWLDTVHSSTQVRDPQQARQALRPLTEMANKTGASVLLIAHTNRQDTANLRDKIGATGALRQKVRILLYAAQPPDSTGVLYVGPDKANGAPLSDAVAYRLDIRQVRPATDDDPGTTARLLADARTTAPMRDHVARWAEDRRRQENPSAEDRLRDWFHTWLAQNGTLDGDDVVVPTKTTQQAAEAANFSSRNLTPIVRAMGGVSKPSGLGGDWQYRIPKSSLASVASLEVLQATATLARNTDETPVGALFEAKP